MQKNYFKNLNYKNSIFFLFVKNNYDNILYKMYPEYLNFIIKFAIFFIENFPLVFWFLDKINYSPFIILYILCWFFFIFILFFQRIKDLFLKLRDYYLLNSYYEIYLKVNQIFFFLNPRAFINYTFLLKYDINPVTKKQLQEVYGRTLDFVETRQIYSRIYEYLNILNVRYLNNDYLIEEKEIIAFQIEFAYKILADLKIFYRGFHHTEAEWMRKYLFKEKFENYLIACNNYPLLIKKRNHLANIIEPKFLDFYKFFLTSLRSNAKSEDVILLKHHLYKNYKVDFLSLENYLENLNNFNMELIYILHESFTDLDLYNNKNSSNSLKLYNFLTCFSFFKEISDLDNEILVSNFIIAYYLNGVDIILQDLLNSVVKPLTVYKRRVIITQFKYNQEEKYQILILQNLSNFIKNYFHSFLNFSWKIINKYNFLTQIYIKWVYIFNIIYNFEYSYSNFKRIILKWLD